MSDDEPRTPGWDAIDDALRPIYGDREPKHFAPILRASLGGPDPLDGISAYKRLDATPHWHFVTYGFTDLYVKETDVPEISGYGFELTFRLACRPDDDAPPAWAINLLQNLARYVFRTGNDFAAGHHMTLNGPIALGATTDLTAVLFAADPELAASQGPFGRFDFVQIVGITADELEAIQAWDCDRFTSLLASSNPLLVTDLARASLLADARTARRVHEGSERDGSSLGRLYVTTARWNRTDTRTRMTIDALATSSFVRQLRGRLLHTRPLTLVGKGNGAEHVIAFQPAERGSVEVSAQGHLVVSLARAVAVELIGNLEPRRGIYRTALDDLEIEVVPTEIKDARGNVIRVIG